MSTATVATFYQKQQGGMTIIMALVLVAVLGAATFSLSRNVVRELSMAGSVIQGEKAAAAADAGLDWVITWGQGHVSDADYSAASPTSGQKALVDGINNQMLGIATGTPITIYGVSDTAMRMDNGGAAAARQSFDVELRYLGKGWGNAPIVGGGGSSDNTAASNDTKGNLASITPKGWRGLITGYATPTSTSQTYQAQREVIATFPN